MKRVVACASARSSAAGGTCCVSPSRPRARALRAPRQARETVAPKPLIPRGATKLGAVAPTKAISGAVVLQPRDESALAHFISQVTDKHSPLFHQYLTPGDASRREFGATSSTIAAVESQLQSAGLTVTKVAPDGLIVDFTAPASRVESEFQTGLERYKLANGSIEHARTAPVKVPATIGKDVTSVVGLDTTVRLRPLGIFHGDRGRRGGHIRPPSTRSSRTRRARRRACSDASTPRRSSAA